MPAWTAADALTWWKVHAPAVTAARRATIEALGSAPATVTIDQGRLWSS